MINCAEVKLWNEAGKLKASAYVNPNRRLIKD